MTKNSPIFDKPNFNHCASRRKGVAKQTPFSGLGLIPIYWSNVRCRGDEENILLCEKDIWQGGACPQKMAAAVTCSFSQGKKVSSFTFIVFSTGFQMIKLSPLNHFLKEFEYRCKSESSYYSQIVFDRSASSILNSI